MCVALGDLHEVSVVRCTKGQLPDGRHLGFHRRSRTFAIGLREVLARLQAAAKPLPQRRLLLLVPWGPAPPAFVLRLLDQFDEPLFFDELYALGNQLAIPVGPMSGDVGVGDRAVALEPRGFDDSLLHLAGQHDLEGPLAQVHQWNRVEVVGEGWFVKEPIKSVT